ncbi:MAG: glucose-1-phosphate cytidylyltransferase [Parvularculaceae bacterium]|nr:glucose-1-phosphate cytidylyltransferase [Parvularculaceae bacterium]
MKVGILAGGYGSRLAEETDIRPKPMVEIGGMPILWHIMKIYAHYGVREFAVALGYKGDYIKRWFRDYSLYGGSMTFDTGTGELKRHGADAPDWRVDLVETGLNTLTGGRIKRLRDWMGDGTFMLTWGDGVADVDIRDLLAFHKRHGKLATMTAVRPPARYGHIEFDGDRVCEFSEKPQTGEGWINGAFFVLEPQVCDYIDGDFVMFEHEPMRRLAADGQLMAYKHSSFWQCMDTLREKQILQTMWESGKAPWKVWS